MSTPGGTERVTEQFEGTLVDTATGQVLEHFSRPADSVDAVIAAAQAEGKIVVRGHIPFDRLYNPETKRTRARPTWSPKAEANAVTGLPDGTRAMVEGEWAEVVDGAVKIAADWPQDVTVFIQHPQHGEMELTVHCAPVAGKVAPDAVKIAQDVGLLRAGAYLPVGDQLDLIVKGLARLPGAQAVPELKAVIDASAAVKTTFPKKG